MLPKRIKIKSQLLVALSFSLVGCSSYPKFEKPAEYTPPNHDYASVSFYQSVGLKGFQYDPNGNKYTSAQKLRFTEKEYSVSVFTDHDSCKDQKKVNFRDIRETAYNRLPLPKSELATIKIKWRSAGLSCENLVTFPITRSSSYSVVHQIGVYSCNVFVYDDATAQKVSLYDRQKGKASIWNRRTNSNYCEPKDLEPSKLVTSSYDKLTGSFKP